jgi:hypothetical protein
LERIGSRSLEKKTNNRKIAIEELRELLLEAKKDKEFVNT